ncbi:MAG: hypothetical protein IPN76_34815 [Saprospiraceae bacterium]|nr:hypothetical protein [Saprospiraceae bacterium]
MAGSTQRFNNWFDDVYLVRTDADGALLWQQSYVRDRKDIPHSIELLQDGSFAIAAHSRVDDVNGSVLNSTGQVFRIGPTGQLLSNYVQGQVFFDENNDCLPTANEQHFGGCTSPPPKLALEVAWCSMASQTMTGASPS